MESYIHSIKNLFEQLGLASDSQAIEDFISRHKPLPKKIALHDAEFWTPSQAAFLLQAVEEDADWSIIVDNLDNLLR